MSEPQTESLQWMKAEAERLRLESIARARWLCICGLLFAGYIIGNFIWEAFS